MILVLGRLGQDGCHIGNLATDSHPDLECDTQTWYTMNAHTPTKNNLESRAHSRLTSLVFPFFLSLVFIISSFSDDRNQPLWGSLPEAFGTMFELGNISSSSVCIMQLAIPSAGLQDGNLKTLGISCQRQRPCRGTWKESSRALCSLRGQEGQ